MMNKSKMQRILSLLLIVTMLFSSNSITVLAGSDADTSTGGITTPGGNHNRGSKYKASINIDGGGYKISIATAKLDAYEPKDMEETPLYGIKGKGKESAKAKKGITPISVNGASVIADHDSGRYGIAPIYFVGNWSDENEWAIDSNFNFSLQKNTIRGKRINPKVNDNVDKTKLIQAANQSNIKDNKIWNNIYKAFNQVDILKGTKDINESLKMVRKYEGMTKDEEQHNLDIINTLLNFAILSYGSNTPMGEYIKELQDANMKSCEVILIIEPMAHINVEGTGAGYITPANFILGTSNITAKQYTGFEDFDELMKAYKHNSNYGLWEGMGTYIVGMPVKDGRGNIKYTGAIGSGLGGDNGDINNRGKYRQALAAKTVYTGPLKWSNGAIARAEINSMKWGFGCLGSSDYVEPVSTSRIIESNSSISVLGDMAGYTPIISVGITTNKGVADPVLDDAVSGAIEKLNSFAGENTMAIEDLDDYLSSDSCIEILKLIIENVDQSYIADTSISNKIEDINGKITELLGKGKLNIDSLLIAKYMNLLMKNSTYDEDAYITEAGTEKHIMNFNTESNRDLIRYIYTMFDDKFNSSYTVLTNIEEALYDEPETGNVERYSQNYRNNTVLKSKLNPVRQRDGAYILKERPSKPAVAGQIKFFGDTSASIMRNETTKEFSGKMSSFTSIVDGDGVVKTESDTMNKLVKLAMI